MNNKLNELIKNNQAVINERIAEVGYEEFVKEIFESFQEKLETCKDVFNRLKDR